SRARLPLGEHRRRSVEALRADRLRPGERITGPERDLAIDPAHPLAPDANVVLADHEFPAAELQLAHARSWLPHPIEDAFSEGAAVAQGKEQPGVEPAQDLLERWDVGGHDRDAEPQRIEQREGQPLPARGKYSQVDPLVERPQPLGTGDELDVRL